MPETVSARARLRFGPRNYVFLAAGVVSLAVGYWLLSQGSTGVAPVLLCRYWRFVGLAL
jgi:hypothetical protein